LAIYPLSLHDALPILTPSSIFTCTRSSTKVASNCSDVCHFIFFFLLWRRNSFSIDESYVKESGFATMCTSTPSCFIVKATSNARSEEYTSELQSRENL